MKVHFNYSDPLDLFFFLRLLAIKRKQLPLEERLNEKNHSK